MRNLEFLPRRFRVLQFRLRECRSLEIFLAATFLFFLPPTASAQTSHLQQNESERQLFEALNHERAAHSLPALRWDDSLFKAARIHALRMVNLNQLEHQLPNEPKLQERCADAGARFSVIAENIAVGSNPNTIHNGWMESPGHRRNILDARYNSVGIAVVRGTGGLFAVQDFSHSISNLTVEQQEQAVASLLKARGFQISGDASEDARRSCESHKANPGNGVRSMMWFETTDLSALPEDVARRLENEPHRKVSVGACNAKDETGFPHFRIAILFF
jgi:uncharacterized protein YkwD